MSCNKPVNVLYIIWSLALGGAERVVINLAKGLDRVRFNPVVCCLNDEGQFAGELKSEGIKVIALNKQGKFDVSIINKLVKVIKENNISIVNTHLWGANFWGRIAARKAGVPVIIATEHNSDTWKTWLHFILDRWISGFTDKIIAVSASVRDFYVSSGITAEKIEVIYNGIDAADFKPKNSKEETVLAIIGRLVEQKGHRYLFEALNALNGQHKIKLLVVGDGPLKDSLHDIVSNLRLEDRIVFTGFRKDVPELLKKIDVLVMPSLREGLPIIALEAMAAGVPVVATKVGGIPELITDGKTGVLVEPRNPKALEDGIIRIIDDANLMNEIIHNARKRVEEEFNVNTMAGKTQLLYENILAGKLI